MALVAERNFSETSVVKICHAAEVSRQTFYQHFPDKFALLEECLRSILRIPTSEYQKCDRMPIADRTFLLIRVVAAQCSTRRKFLQTILDDKTLPAYSHYFFDIIAEGIAQTFWRMAGDKHQRSISLEVTLSFAIGGIIGAFKVWVDRGHDNELEPFCHSLARLLLHAFGGPQDSGPGPSAQSY